ncbi:hypothetical protein [Mycolicibacterium moriokaense]|uniref:Uncharacterized protein n=1 Tax=Mycolicibacterium moriokaense TaxID=39691 RepID=A0AAD1HAP3_9MYCO|nr:hypothetical protein [Mycolicibacterium moriokaense]MCV7039741.1 hypothetical protein [Mycolicibacterium moriokaense]BBX01812.1 hypothetical protein MMOR_27480 [Mycolicibacterium moriokaense]
MTSDLLGKAILLASVAAEAGRLEARLRLAAIEKWVRCMTALAVIAIIVGCLPIVAGAVYMFLIGPGAFIGALVTCVIVAGGLAAAIWGLSVLTLAGAS